MPLSIQSARQLYGATTIALKAMAPTQNHYSSCAASTFMEAVRHDELHSERACAARERARQLRAPFERMDEAQPYLKREDEIARGNEHYMLNHGALWKGVTQNLQQSGELRADESLTLERLSEINLQKLKNRLEAGGPLHEKEVEFIQQFRNENFYACHFTPKPLVLSTCPHVNAPTVALFSRQELLKQDRAFAKHHTHVIDQTLTADDGYVFFSLEAGDIPSKRSSRFGNEVYRFPLLAHGMSHYVDGHHFWGALDDLVHDTEKNTRARMPMLSDAEVRVIDRVSNHQRSNEKAIIGKRPLDASDVFEGRNLINASAFAVVDRMRAIKTHNADLWNKLYDMANERYTPYGRVSVPFTPVVPATLLNLLYRAEVRVPSAFFAMHGQHYSFQNRTTTLQEAQRRDFFNPL